MGGGCEGGRSKNTVKESEESRESLRERGEVMVLRKVPLED